MGAEDSGWMNRLKRNMIVGMILFLAFTIALIALILRHNLLLDSKQKTSELSNAIRLSLRSQMLEGAPNEMFQQTLEHIAGEQSSIISISILKLDGTVIFSSDRAELGIPMAEACNDCHFKSGRIPEQSTLVYRSGDQRIHRNVSLIMNERDCMGCHPAGNVLGKMVIDRSLEGTYNLLGLVEVVLAGSGLALVFIMTPLLMISINRYIKEIAAQGEELRLMHNMIERLSNTIDTAELISVSVDLIKDLFDADEIDVVIPTYKNNFIVKHWDRSGEIRRRKLSETEPLREIIDGWLAGDLKDPIVGDGSMVAYVPISKGESSLVLISIKRDSKPLNRTGLRLIDTLSAHSAVAFENARLYYLAITDELTHMFTQRHFRHCICRDQIHADEQGEKLTLVMADIDNFKSVNDTYGHLCGDEILKGVAERTLGCIRNDDRAFRYGGEEFAIIMFGADSESGMESAERIRKRIEDEPFETPC